MFFEALDIYTFVPITEEDARRLKLSLEMVAHRLAEPEALEPKEPEREFGEPEEREEHEEHEESSSGRIQIDSLLTWHGGWLERERFPKPG